VEPVQLTGRQVFRIIILITVQPPFINAHPRRYSAIQLIGGKLKTRILNETSSTFFPFFFFASYVEENSQSSLQMKGW
jgi:hypothetical protein